MRLEDIGFYTLCDKRAAEACATSPMWRCEMIVTDRCNFKCPYCRGLRPDCRGDMSLDSAIRTLDIWISEGLRNVRFSGGEPTVWLHLSKVVSYCKSNGVKRIAISTNGSAPIERYMELLALGVDDFSVSFDACCASFANQMAGVDARFDHICSVIKSLSPLSYVTTGTVITDANVSDVCRIVELADKLGVADIRVIPAAQKNRLLDGMGGISDAVLDRHPILKYRTNNIRNGRGVRGMTLSSCRTCWLAIDDSVVSGDFHFPCVIYMREQGNPIGRVGPTMRHDRIEWMKSHDCFSDTICRMNCLDVCLDYMQRFSELNPQAKG